MLLLHAQAKPREVAPPLRSRPRCESGSKRGVALPPGGGCVRPAAPSIGSPPAGPREQGLTGCSSPALAFSRAVYAP